MSADAWAGLPQVGTILFVLKLLLMGVDDIQGMYVCVCVCMYVCMYCMFECMYACMHARMYVYM